MLFKSALPLDDINGLLYNADVLLTRVDEGDKSVVGRVASDDEIFYNRFKGALGQRHQRVWIQNDLSTWGELGCRKTKKKNVLISDGKCWDGNWPGNEAAATVEIEFEAKFSSFTAEESDDRSAAPTDVIWLLATFSHENCVKLLNPNGIFVMLFPLRSNVSTGVVGGTLAMITAIATLVRFWFAQEIVSVVVLPAVGWQLHGAIDATGHLQFNSVNELNGVVSLHVAFLT